MHDSHYPHRKQAATILGAALPACQFCDATLPSRQMVTLRATESARLIHVQCPRCHGSFVTLVLIHELGMGSVSLATDLLVNDVRQFSAADPIAIDDVLNIHQLLRNSSVTATI